MSTTTLARPAVRRRTPTARTARHLLTMLLYLAVWFWGIAVVVLTVAILLVDRFGDVTTSVVQFARQGGIWFPFSLTIIIATTYLPTHVAAGMTRRAFATAALVASVVTAAVYAGVLTLLIQVERLVYERAGWTHALTDIGLSATSSGTAVDLGRLFLDYLLMFGSGVVSGLLVGIVYYRAGGWWGTLALPLTIGPLFLVTALLASDAGPFDLAWVVERLGPGGDDALARVSLCVLIIAAQAAAFHRITRRAALNPVTT
ncbi:hypothetical protein AB6N24_03570 [Cellulomonas sp. 179-A 4D5 NHS]|uniref:hypothetical protein n=1 Tax=Cellulomonas sp. 179-A 4D5 NHS TaxID=3142378 RepID=UPI0039A39C84